MKRRRTRWTILAALWVAAVALPVGVFAQAAASTATVVDRLDAAAREHIESVVVPGVSVAVAIGDEIVLERGYGSVDLEWDVATPADGSASYEIGSITKQFTAAAVLLLVEEGLLDLDADFTNYIDFDTDGRTIPLRRLLDHTSGMRSYTEMAVFGDLVPRKLPRDTLVRAVEAHPFDFEPGTALIYNNSAYFLVGLIIEEVSGTSYEEFVEERLFGPAGMADSYYCSESAVREGRAHGYDAVGPERLIRARYLDHTWPYAAGSLCSTVGDLVRWNRALHGGQLLSSTSYDLMTTPHPLEDGTRVRYAMGLSATETGGRRMIAHGGGINGFLSDGRYFPDDDLTVIVLQNSTGQPGPGALSQTLAEVVLGPTTPVPAADYAGDLEELTGTYVGAARGSSMTMVVEVTDEGLGLRVNGGAVQHPAYSDGLTWTSGSTRFVFRRSGSTITEVRFDAPSAHYVLRRN